MIQLIGFFILLAVLYWIGEYFDLFLATIGSVVLAVLGVTKKLSDKINKK